MTSTHSVKAIICDLGDVLFDWSPSTATSISPKTLRRFLSTDIWFEYECGRLSRAECYQQLSERYSVSRDEVTDCTARATSSLSVNKDMVSFLMNVKSHGALKVYAMSNVSMEDSQILFRKMATWSQLFDRRFISGLAGLRKPDPNFYRYVLEETGLAASEALFIDDNEKNVHAARELGLQSIVFTDSLAIIRKNFFGGPVEKAYQWLCLNGKKFDSITSVGVEFSDNFSQLLVLEATRDRNLVDLEWDSDVKKQWNYFTGSQPLVHRGSLPDDLDTTCLALKNLHPSSAVVSSMLDEMKEEWMNDQGSFWAYYDRSRPRLDDVVTANVLACFYHFGRGNELPTTLELIGKNLQNRAYLQPSRYYVSPDVSLFFFGRLLQSSSDTELHAKLGYLMRTRVEERLGLDGSAADLAMRIITATPLGLNCDKDRQALMKLQQEDGGWEASWMWRYGVSGILIGNRGLTTAMAFRALLS